MSDWLRRKLGVASNRNPWGSWGLYGIIKTRAKRPLCLVLRHKHRARETMLIAMASGRSRRCPSCNRLVLKRQYR